MTDAPDIRAAAADADLIARQAEELVNWREACRDLERKIAEMKAPPSRSAEIARIEEAERLARAGLWADACNAYRAAVASLAGRAEALEGALRGLRYRDEPSRFCDHAAAPCPRCDAARAALAPSAAPEAGK